MKVTLSAVVDQTPSTRVMLSTYELMPGKWGWEGSIIAVERKGGPNILTHESLAEVDNIMTYYPTSEHAIDAAVSYFDGSGYSGWVVSPQPRYPEDAHI